MPDASETSVPRKKFLVSAPLQVSVALSVLGTVVLFTGVYAVAILLVGSDGSSWDDLSSQAATRLGMLVTGVYFLLVLLAVFVVAIRSTHRIAGPLGVIEAAARGMLEGDLEQRLELRDRDHLKSLAEAMTEIRKRWQTEREARRDYHVRFRQALEEGDLGKLGQLHQEFAGTFVELETEREAA